MVWPFNRKKNTEDVPQEVQDYYQSERRERAGVAWLLAFGTLLLTIALAIGLFFGGRWVYREWFDNNDEQSVATDSEQSDSENKDEQNTQGSSTQNPPASSPTTSPTGQPTVSPEAATTNTPSTPATGELPDTGPGDHFD